MADELTMAAVVDAIIEAGLRNHDGGEYLTPETPLREIHFKGGDRTLAGIEFVARSRIFTAERSRTATPVPSYRGLTTDAERLPTLWR